MSSMATVANTQITEKSNIDISNMVILRGWLFKKSRKMGIYRHRYIVLRGSYLVCYKTSNYGLEIPTEILDLINSNCNVKRDHLIKQQFYIQSTSSKRIFRAKNVQKCNKWIYKIKLIININKNNKTINIHYLNNIITSKSISLVTPSIINKNRIQNNNNNNINEALPRAYRCCSTLFFDDDIDIKQHNSNINISRLFYEKNRLWPNGSILRVYFMDKTNDIHNKILSIASKWSQYCNIKFIQTYNRCLSDIRIDFDETEGSWSFIGNYALKVNKNSKTMNFGWFKTINDPDDYEYNTTVLHEFGHVLGFKHEHLHPIHSIPYDKYKVYYYYKKYNGWSKKSIDKNILNPVNINSVCGLQTSIDKYSIMLYRIIPELLQKNHSKIFDEMNHRNHKLSLMDKQKIYRFYPFYYPKIGSIIKILSKKKVIESFKIANRKSYDYGLYDKYCNKKGIVHLHHPTNGIAVRFRYDIVWFEPTSMIKLIQYKSSYNNGIYGSYSLKNSAQKMNRLFIGDSVRILDDTSLYENKEGIIQFHDDIKYGYDLITVSIKPHTDLLVQIHSDKIKKLQSHQINRKYEPYVSSDCQCRAMLITSFNRKSCSDIMKKYLIKSGHVMVSQNDIIIFDRDNDDLTKIKLLNGIKSMFNDSKRNNFIIYYSGLSQNINGNWKFNGLYHQFNISLEDIINLWISKKNHRYFIEFNNSQCSYSGQKGLRIICDCNYSGKWIDFYNLNYSSLKGNVVIQASCGSNQTCDIGVFTRRWIPGSIILFKDAIQWNIDDYCRLIPSAISFPFKSLLYDLPKIAYNYKTYSFQPTYIRPPKYPKYMSGSCYIIAVTPTQIVTLYFISRWYSCDAFKHMQIFSAVTIPYVNDNKI